MSFFDSFNGYRKYQNSLRYKFLWVLLILLLLLIGIYVGIYYWQHGQFSKQAQDQMANSEIYSNDKYGFSIALPESWKGYSVLNSQWEARNVATGHVVDHGPIIMLRYPQWNVGNPREDMPIMVFTPTQWNLMQSEQMSVGAAPIPPSVLGQNSKYILALPARYNYDFKTGWEEVDRLVHTLKAY